MTDLSLHADALIKALELALPYVQKVAATNPTTLSRHQRQRQASEDAKLICDLLRAARSRDGA